MFGNNVKAFIAWEALNSESIKFKRSYVELTGDLNAGLLLSQIVYWNLPDKKGNTKLRVQKQGELWLAKKRTDWWDECCLTPKQFDRAITILEEKDLVNCKLFRFDGSPTKHIQLKWENLLDGLEALSARFLPKGENPISPSGELDIAERGKTITETTAETTNRDYNDRRLSVSSKTLCDTSSSEKLSTSDDTVKPENLESLDTNPIPDQHLGVVPEPKNKDSSPAILPKKKKLTYDGDGWLQLPTKHRQFKLASKLAIRRMQIVLIFDVLEDFEVEWQDDKPYFDSGWDEGFENEFFSESSGQALRALRDYGSAHHGLSQDWYNDRLEELFQDSVTCCFEKGFEWVSKVLDDGMVFADFDDTDTEFI